MPADIAARAYAEVSFTAMDCDCALLAVPATPARQVQLERCRAWIEASAARLTRFERDSELSALNAAAGSWVEVGDLTEAVLREALRAYQASAGLVNAAVLPALLAAGYDRTFTRLATPGSARRVTPPGPAPPLPAVLEVVPGRARVQKGAGIDLGGIAKGWLADRAAERLAGNALANLGGDLRAIGDGPAGAGWPVAFGGRTLLLGDQGAATSSVLKRAWSGGHHLIDPRSGLPAAGDLWEVSVVARDAVAAEVHAKAALLLGTEAAPRYLEGRAEAWWLAAPEGRA